MRASQVANAQVRDVPWPDSATLVSIQRGTGVIIPHGNTVLQAGDGLTFFGTGDARVELAHLMEPSGAATGEWRLE